MLILIQCTGVAVERFQQSSWCCFFTENPIDVKSGSNVLIHKPEVQTGCLFGFDPETNCTRCLSIRRYDVTVMYLSNGQSTNDVFFNIVLSGPLCMQIGGTILILSKMFQFFTKCYCSIVDKSIILSLTENCACRI